MSSEKSDKEETPSTVWQALHSPAHPRYYDEQGKLRGETAVDYDSMMENIIAERKRQNDAAEDSKSSAWDWMKDRSN